MTKKREENNRNIRLRFAPSPTGSFHIGSARTALFNYLYAQKMRGVLILRIEDTDKERSGKIHEEDIMRSLLWLGITWEEGVFEDGERGDYGPYRQSERGDIYKRYVKKLIEDNKAYYCFCAKEKLDKERKESEKKKIAPKYSGACRNLPIKEQNKKIEKGEGHVIRLRLPENEIIKFDDQIRGNVSFSSKELGGDFVIAKENFYPLYNFACVIDDYEMKITHVMRGEDHISNTPKQIAIQKALNIKIPEYAHLPLILGTDKSKLSKRHGAVSLFEYREKGYLPEALINFISFLGWNPGGDREIYSKEEIIERFSLSRCQKSGAVFNIDKLTSINGYYIRNMELERLTRISIPYLISEKLIAEKGGDKYHLPKRNEEISIDEIKKIVSLYQERIKILSEVAVITDYFFVEKLDYEPDLFLWKDATFEDTIKQLENCIEVVKSIKKWELDTIKDYLVREASRNDNKGLFLWPVRVALSGKKASAGPFEIIWVMGREMAIKRLKTAIEVLKKVK